MEDGSERRYRRLVEAITDYAIYMLDIEGRVVSWNPGAERFKGYRAEEIIGHSFERFYTEEDRARGAPRAALRAAAEEGRFEAEGWRVRKDGGQFWAHVVVDPIRDETGQVIGYAKITRDLTERREVEEALRHSQEQFRLLVQSVTDYAIYMLDRRGHVVSWNAGAARIKGYAPEEIIGEHFSRFYTEEDRRTGFPFTALETAAAEGRFENEGWRLRKDGSRFWALALIDPIRNEDGEIIGFAKVTRDITERRQQQEALQAAQEALFHSQKLEALGQLTGGVAHDFNNLLMAIMGSLELVQKRLGYDPRLSPFIENAIQGAERGAALTKRMLAFARKQKLELQSVDVAALIQGFADFCQRSISPNVRLVVETSPRLPAVQADPNQLETTLLNLALNARDAMPHGGEIRIFADSRRHDGSWGGFPAGEFVRIGIQDHGCGMDAAILNRATEPFFTTKGVGRGTGLGLSMAHGMAAQSGGGLRIESEPGRGTCVEIWLPLALEEAALQRNSIEGTPAISPTSRHTAVLAVDDDRLVLTNTIAMLEDLGYEAVPAASADEAIAVLARRTDIRLLITDEMMPDMNGSSLVKAAREMRPGLPVLTVTGYAEIDLEGGEGARPPCLAKPFTQKQLAQAIALVSEPHRA